MCKRSTASWPHSSHRSAACENTALLASLDMVASMAFRKLLKQNACIAVNNSQRTLSVPDMDFLRGTVQSVHKHEKACQTCYHFRQLCGRCWRTSIDVANEKQSETAARNDTVSFNNMLESIAETCGLLPHKRLKHANMLMNLMSLN